MHRSVDHIASDRHLDKGILLVHRWSIDPGPMAVKSCLKVRAPKSLLYINCLIPALATEIRSASLRRRRTIGSNLLDRGPVVELFGPTSERKLVAINHQKSCNSRVDCRELCLIVVALDGCKGDSSPPISLSASSLTHCTRRDVLDERQIGDGRLAGYEPLLLGQYPFEHTEHTLDLLLVAFHCAGNLLRVELREPGVLAEIWALSGRLEEQPLELLVLVGLGCGGDLVACVVLVDEVRQNRARLPVNLSIDELNHTAGKRGADQRTRSPFL